MFEKITIFFGCVGFFLWLECAQQDDNFSPKDSENVTFVPSVRRNYAIYACFLVFSFQCTVTEEQQDDACNGGVRYDEFHFTDIEVSY